MKGPNLPIVIGNWKMHKTIPEAIAFVQALLPHINALSPSVYLAVPFTALRTLVDKFRGTSVRFGAQNMHAADGGAFTGEISGAMLKDAGAAFVLIGHSERRRLFGEDSATINKKVKAALSIGLQPVVCVGETLEERERGVGKDVVAHQLSESLEGLTADDINGLMIAYEPVWAIGTGKTATAAHAQEMHAFCRSLCQKLFGNEAASRIPVLYGGSVKPDNTKGLMEQHDIDGVLVGGASLSPDSFFGIINFKAKQNTYSKGNL